MKAVGGMGFGRPSHVGSVGTGREPSTPKWERTPWWVFWRPYWRRLNPNYWDTIGRYEYRSKRQLAHEFLAKQFAPTHGEEHRQGSANYIVDSSSWTGRPK